MLPKKHFLPLLSVLVLAVALLSVPAHAQHDHAAHAHITAPAPPTTPRWAAEGALRDGMERIHTALVELRDYETGRMNTAAALDRVGLIEQAAADIFAKCKLTPDQDAVLHGMLMPLLSAAQQLRADPQDTAQVEAMRKAVLDYPRYFDPSGGGAGEHGAR